MEENLQIASSLEAEYASLVARTAIETGRPCGEIAREVAEMLIASLHLPTGRPPTLAAHLTDWGYVNRRSLAAIREFVAQRIATNAEPLFVWLAAGEHLKSSRPGRLAEILPSNQMELLVARRLLCEEWGGGN